jgi:hypothetical protein
LKEKDKMKPKKPDFLNLLSSKTKGVGECKGVRGFLANTWRQLLFESNMNATKFISLMGIWLSKDASQRKNSGVVGAASARSNLVKAMWAKTMTWKVLCTSARVLGVVRVRCTFEWYWANGRSIVTVGELDISAEAGDTGDEDDDELAQAQTQAQQEPPPWAEPSGDDRSHPPL